MVKRVDDPIANKVIKNSKFPIDAPIKCHFKNQS